MKSEHVPAREWWAITKRILNLLTIITVIIFAGLILGGFIEELPASIAPAKESVKILSDFSPVFTSFSIFSATLFAHSKSRDYHLLFIGMVFVIVLIVVLYSEERSINPKVIPSNTHVDYISSSGSDSNLGTLESPWKTFNYSIPRLVAGDTLILLDGTYESATTGLPEIYCSNGAPNGQPGKPITMKARNERKAFLKADNTTPGVFFMQDCAYWQIEGLRFEGGDFSSSISSAVFTVYQSHDITLRRLLGAKSNRYGNNHLIALSNSYNILAEENELYQFHRHGLFSFYSYNVTYRRNYVNSRNYPDLAGSGYSSSDPTTGDAALSFYPAYNSTQENNIVENVMHAFTEIGTDPAATDNNRFLGNIGINTTSSAPFRADGRYGNVIRNTQYIDSIAVNVQGGFDLTDTKNTKVDRATIINLVPVNGYPSYGMLLSNSYTSANESDTAVSNVLVNSAQGAAGFYANSLYGWSFDYTNVFGGVSSAWNPDDSHVTNSMQINPKLGSCIAWIPSSSPLKGAGKNGTDIGANILYRYENGVLTDQPLWDPVTGEFPHGAIIAGVNDIPGQSAFDVNKRLNINTNGCLFPYGYGNYSLLSKILGFIKRLLFG